MKVGFILLSSPAAPIPSTRIAALNMWPLLAQRGICCELIYAPDQGVEQPDLPLDANDIADQGFDVVCFQKVHGPSAEALATALRLRGVGTVFIVCDVVDEGMCDATDATAVVTDYLRSLYPQRLQAKIHVVHDGIEQPECHKPSPGGEHVHTVLTAVLVTSSQLTEVPVIGPPPKWLRVVLVGRYASSWRRQLVEDWWTLQRLPDWRRRLSFLRFLLNPRIRRVTWSADGVYDALLEADVGIIPIDHTRTDSTTPAPSWKRKSENRLTLKMAIGLPVVATPIPAYEPVVQHGENAYFARTREEWLHALSVLRDPAQRARISERARASVLERYSMQAQSMALQQVIEFARREASARACLLAESTRHQTARPAAVPPPSCNLGQAR